MVHMTHLSLLAQMALYAHISGHMAINRAGHSAGGAGRPFYLLFTQTCGQGRRHRVYLYSSGGRITEQGSSAQQETWIRQQKVWTAPPPGGIVVPAGQGG